MGEQYHHTPFTSTTFLVSKPDLLTLRGHFRIAQTPERAGAQELHSVNQVFPITDEHAILVTQHGAALVHAPTRSIHWTISCASALAACHVPTARLALAAQGAIYLWDLLTGEMKQQLDIGEDVPTDMAFSMDGRLLATALYNDGVALWNAADGELLHTLQVSGEEYPASKSVAISPEGYYVATGNFETDSVWLWRVADGQLLHQMEERPRGSRVEGLAFSPDGRWLVCGECGGSDDELWMRVWDVATGRADDGFPRKAWKPVFHHSGQILAATCIEESLRPIYIWDAEIRNELCRLNGHRERVTHMSFSPSGRMLVTCGDDRTVRWWNFHNGQELYRIEALLSTRPSSALSADGTLLAAGASDGAMRLWHVPTGKLQRTYQYLGSQGEGGIALRADGQQLVSWTQALLFSGSLCLWQTGSPESRPRRLRGPHHWVYCATFNHRGDRLAVGNEDRGVRLWDVEASQVMQTCEGHSGRISSVAFNPDDTLLASGSSDRTIRLWNVPDGLSLMVLEGHQQTITSLTFSPSGRVLASGSSDGEVRLWDLASGQLYTTLRNGSEPIVSLAFSGDGLRLASATYSGSIRVWSLAERGMDGMQDSGQRAAIRPRIFALNGASLQAYPLQESVLLWELPAGYSTYQIEHEHTHLTSLAYRADGVLLVVGYCSGQTAVWRLEEL